MGDHVEGETRGTSDPSALPERWVFLRSRPCNAARFLAFARETFGPLSRDHLHTAQEEGDEESGRPLLRADDWRTSVREGSGCLWFAGSDDLAAEWRFRALESERTHLLRCGAPWPEEEEEVGSRRTELTFWIDGPEADIAKKLLSEGLRACLLTRDEAVEAERTGRIPGTEEWDEERLNNANMAQWADRFAPALHVVHGLASFVSAVPGVQRTSAIANGYLSQLLGQFGAECSTEEPDGCVECGSPYAPGRLPGDVHP